MNDRSDEMLAELRLIRYGVWSLVVLAIVGVAAILGPGFYVPVAAFIVLYFCVLKLQRWSHRTKA